MKLLQNQGLVFQGAIILGDGFLVDDDTFSKWETGNDSSCEVVFDYLIGKEVNQSPIHSPGRKVINFFDWNEDKAASYPNAFNHVVENVKPERMLGKDKGARKSWWRYLRPRPELFHLIGRGHSFEKHPAKWDETQEPLNRVIVFARAATKYPCFTFVPNTYVYADSTCVIASQSFSLFVCLSSDVHTIWAWEYCSKMKQDMRYTHGEIFETFPFPTSVLECDNETLSDLGKRFFKLRSQYMQTNNKGMTKFYNDVHDPANTLDAIQEFRELQVDINSAVLKAYDIEDIDLNHDFHEVAYLPEGKDIRFTVSEAAREELLYRLALLNKKRYEEEVAQGLHDKKKTKKTSTPRKKKTSQAKGDGNMDLFDFMYVSPKGSK